MVILSVVLFIVFFIAAAMMYRRRKHQQLFEKNIREFYERYEENFVREETFRRIESGEL